MDPVRDLETITEELRLKVKNKSVILISDVLIKLSVILLV